MLVYFLVAYLQTIDRLLILAILLVYLVYYLEYSYYYLAYVCKESRIFWIMVHYGGVVVTIQKIICNLI